MFIYLKYSFLQPFHMHKFVAESQRATLTAQAGLTGTDVVLKVLISYDTAKVCLHFRQEGEGQSTCLFNYIWSISVINLTNYHYPLARRNYQIIREQLFVPNYTPGTF